MYKKKHQIASLMLHSHTPMITTLPKDIADMICMFAWGVRWHIVSHEIPVVEECQQNLPPSFLFQELPCTDQWGHVANPFKRFNPYHPLCLLDTSRPFNYLAGKLCHQIDKKHIRQLRTYRGVCMRRAIRLMNDTIEGWNSVYAALWSKLDESHFRCNANKGMVRKLIGELRTSGPLRLSAP